jgi:eukaryotic-like serine/threonine-protein kinase
MAAAAPLGTGVESACAEAQMIGTDLGHYRILEKIGEGGMGAVYKAEDTHLDRFVAIKVLPEAKASDAERRRRFIQEAKAASALNHPNIITVHDAANADGLYYIVMEYVAGKTVDELVRRRPLRQNEALGYAIQIADALARAHAAGIVHRDLKPSNIMVDEHGQVKVLDFGLAKLTEEEGSTEDETATVESLTEAGTVVGTAAYMSPEQAEGRKVDARTDVFSFGLVLYEMLTGVNPFRRESRISTLSALLNEDPRPISEHSAAAPSELDRAVMRCLRKDPQRRWQSMSDLKSLLEDVKADSESGRSSAGDIPRSGGRRWPIWAAAATVVLVAAFLLGYWLLRSRSTKQELIVARVTSDSGLTWQPTISRDGKLVAYTSDRSGEGKPDIWVRHLDRAEPVRRTNDPVGAVQPTLSPDGSRILFRSERDGGSLYAIDTLGGEERKLADDGSFPRFSPDGNWIVFTRLGATGLAIDNKMYIMPSQGGEARPFLPDYGAVIGRTGLGPVWSPDSKALLFKGARRGDPTWEWFAAPVAGGSAVKVSIAGRFPGAMVQPMPAAWHSPDSIMALHGVSSEGFNLFRLRFSSDTFQVAGAPEELTSGPGLKFNVSVSAEGTVLYDIVTWSTSVAGVALEAATHRAVGDFQPITSDTATKLEACASRNGEKLVWINFTSFNSPRAEVRVRDLASGRESVVGDTTLLMYRYPRLSPDGSLVAYRERVRDGIVTMVAPTGGGTPRRVGTGFLLADFFPGNQDVLILQDSKHLGRLTLSGGETTPLAEATGGTISNPHVSDDGKRVVFTLVRDDGSVALCIVPVRDRLVSESDWVTVVESRKGWLGEPNWSPDRTAIYYCCQDAGLTSIRGRMLDPATGRPVGEPFTVLRQRSLRRTLAGQRTSSSVSVTRDRLYFIIADTTSNLWMLKLPPE